MDVRQTAQVCTAASVKTAMYRLPIRIFLESDQDHDLDAVVEREIELPFVPRRGLRIDFADDVEDGPVDLVLGKRLRRLPHHQRNECERARSRAPASVHARTAHAVKEKRHVS